jgi:hypothetical protein
MLPNKKKLQELFSEIKRKHKAMLLRLLKTINNRKLHFEKAKIVKVSKHQIRQCMMHSVINTSSKFRNKVFPYLLKPVIEEK